MKRKQNITKVKNTFSVPSVLYGLRTQWLLPGAKNETMSVFFKKPMILIEINPFIKIIFIYFVQIRRILFHFVGLYQRNLYTSCLQNCWFSSLFILYIEILLINGLISIKIIGFFGGKLTLFHFERLVVATLFSIHNPRRYGERFLTFFNVFVSSLSAL